MARVATCSSSSKACAGRASQACSRAALLWRTTGVAGLAALERLRSDPALSAQVGLNEGSRVLIISTEGATAPQVYATLVGESDASVHQRQQAWLAQA